MAITGEAPRGAILAEIGGAERVLMLRLAEIERWEDRHYGIYDLSQRLLSGEPPRPKVGELRDLIALGLVGGGMSDKDAEGLASAFAASDLTRIYTWASRLLGVALYPDIVDAPDLDDEDDDPKAPVGA